jgi:hypothetical protein
MIVSQVWRFHQCNVWYPKSQRGLPTGFSDHGAFLTYANFSEYWGAICRNYDELGEHPLDATPATPTNVPILTWMGDRDYFDPTLTQEHWSKLSSKVSFHLMPGWSHDFGADAGAGLKAAVDMILKFKSE